MRLFAAIASALLLLASPAAAQIIGKGPISPHAVTPETIDGRLGESAEHTRTYAPKGAARTALIDFCWPQDDKEYRALGKYIVVLVSAVSQDAAELPLQRVYIKNGGKIVELQRIASIRQNVPKSSVMHAILGGHREDSFYLAPAGAMMRKGTVMADFAVNRSGFRLFELPGLKTPAFVRKDRNPMPAANDQPDLAALTALLDREYTGYTLPKMVRADVR